MFVTPSLASIGAADYTAQSFDDKQFDGRN
jgi:hypothetical protein